MFDELAGVIEELQIPVDEDALVEAFTPDATVTVTTPRRATRARRPPGRPPDQRPAPAAA